jgi:hypothetical protein
MGGVAGHVTCMIDVDAMRRLILARCAELQAARDARREQDRGRPLNPRRRGAGTPRRPETSQKAQLKPRRSPVNDSTRNVRRAAALLKEALACLEAAFTSKPI